jgi:FkbM family methyltransferase
MAVHDVATDLGRCWSLAADLRSRVRLCLNTVLSRTPYVWSAARQSTRRVRVRLGNRCLDVCLRNNGSDVQVLATVLKGGEYDVPGLPWRDLRTIVDAGANIGISTILLARRAPNARILAVEPERSNVAVLRRNVASNALPVKVLSAALWHSTGVLRLAVQNSAMSHSLVSGHGSAAACPEVRCIDVPTLLQENGLSDLDLLKCDIEGAEKELFQRAGSWIHRVRHIILEAHTGRGCDPETMCSLLKGFGFGTSVYGRKDNFIYGRRL